MQQILSDHASNSIGYESSLVMIVALITEPNVA